MGGKRAVWATDDGYAMQGGRTRGGNAKGGGGGEQERAADGKGGEAAGNGNVKGGGKGKGHGRHGVKLPEWHCHQRNIWNRPWRKECHLCHKTAPAQYLNQAKPPKGGGKVGGGTAAGG